MSYQINAVRNLFFFVGLLVMLSACGGGGGGSGSSNSAAVGSTSNPKTNPTAKPTSSPTSVATSTPSTTPTSTPSSTPTPLPTTAAPSTSACASISGCVANSNGFQFPDGSGGTVVCTNGSCVDNNPNGTYNQGYAAGYNQGTSDGYNSGYNSGYNQGSSDGYNSGYNTGYNNGYSDGYNAGYYSSVGSNTKDVDLQKAKFQQIDMTQRAQAIANEFQMNYQAAVQLTQLADKVQKLTVQGKMTDEDRVAITDSALSVAGISPDDVNKAIAKIVKDGDQGAADDLMEKAAKNLGMPSSAGLRDKLLPQVGIRF